MGQIHQDMNKLLYVIKLYDEFRDWVSYASPNAVDMLQDIQEQLSDTVEEEQAANLLAASSGFLDGLIGLMGTEMFNPVLGMILTTVKRDPSMPSMQALIDYMAASNDYTGVITLTDGSNAVTGVGTAFDDEFKDGANGDYLYLKQDGITSRIRILTVTDATNIVLAANYVGSTGTDVLICRTVASRGISKDITYSNSMAGKGKLFYSTKDKYGFEIESPKAENTFRLKVKRAIDYSGLFDIKCLEGISPKLSDAIKARSGSNVSNLELYNTETGGLIPASAANFPYSTSIEASLEANEWYATDGYANVASSNEEFAHAATGSKDPTNWEGTGSSLDFSGAFSMSRKMDKTLFMKNVCYFMAPVFRYKDTSTEGDLTIGLGSTSEVFDGIPSLTGTISVVNGNTTVDGVGTKFIEEVSIGDHIKIDAHADVAWTEVESIESDTELTLVAGGYLGATVGPAAASNYNTGWHWNFINLGFYDDIITSDDLEALISTSGVAEHIYLDSCQIWAAAYHSGLGIWFRWVAGELDVSQGDYIDVSISIATEAKLQRWLADQYRISLVHDSANETFPDPA